MTEKRLLIIDDEPELAEFVAIVGDSLGYTVEVTANAGDFKRIFESFNPTTIVMDIVMPEVTGIELVEWLIEQNYTARVVMASGMNSVYGKSLAERGEEGGLSMSFLNKPFRLESIRECLGDPDSET